MNNSYKIALLFFIPLAWLLGVITIYYVYHKPITPEIALRIIQVLWHCFVVFVVLAISGAIGKKIIKKNELPGLVRLSLEASFGLGIISLVSLILGATLGFNQIGIWGVFILFGIFLRREVLEWIISWGNLTTCWTGVGRFARVLIAGATGIMLLSLICALAPPVKFDSLVYHLVFPRIYLHTGKFIFIPENVFWGMPQTGELLYTISMAMSGIEAATALGWAFAVLSILALVDFVSRFFGSNSAWVTVISLLSGYTLASSTGWGYVDWLVLLFGVGFLVSLTEWFTRGDKNWLIYSGVLAGFAWGTKYTGGILVLTGVVVITWKYISAYIDLAGNINLPDRPVGFKPILSSGLLFVGFASLVVSPWFLKNVLVVGSPFFPFLFPAGDMDRFRIDLYQTSSHWGNWQDLVLLPFRATILGREGGEGYSASISPFLLGLTPFAWFKLRKRDNEQIIIIKIATLVTSCGIIIWAIAGRISGLLIQTRLYFAIFPAIAILAGIGFNNLQRMNWHDIRMSRLIGTLLLLVLGFTLFQLCQVSLFQEGLNYILGVRSSDNYLDKNLGWYMPAMRAIQGLPEGSHVLMLWEPRSLYCLPKCDPDEILDRWLDETHGKGTQLPPQAILEQWQIAGYTHLMYSKAGADFVRQNDRRYLPSDWTTLNNLLSGLAAPVNFGEVYFLYSISP